MLGDRLHQAIQKLLLQYLLTLTELGVGAPGAENSESSRVLNLKLEGQHALLINRRLLGCVSTNAATLVDGKGWNDLNTSILR